MTCPLPSLLTINDGTTVLQVHGHAMLQGIIGQRDSGTGHGIIEYADGSARRWIRFEARIWEISGTGPAPSGLWDLDLTAATWQATFPDPEDPSTNIVATVIPARPATSGKNIATAERPWSLELREAAAR